MIFGSHLMFMKSNAKINQIEMVNIFNGRKFIRKVQGRRFDIVGEGTITKVMDNYVTIRFSTKESKFLFPDSFEKFIKAEDPTLQEEVLDLIKKKDEPDRHQQEEEERKFEKEQNKQVSEITKKRRDVEAGFGKDYNVKYLVKQPYSYLPRGGRTIWN